MGSGYGGFADAAKMLTELGYLTPNGDPIKRQGVYIWYKRRSRNGFPSRYDTGIRTREGKIKEVFKLSEIEEWYKSYVPDQGGRPKQEKEMI